MYYDAKTLDIFFSELSKQIKNNPKVIYSKYYILNALTSYGVKDFSQDSDMGETAKYLSELDTKSYKVGINLKADSKQKEYFTFAFSSKTKLPADGIKFKLYLTVFDDDYALVAKGLTNIILRNNIVCDVRIAKTKRNDSVIIGLTNAIDANFLKNAINDDLIKTKLGIHNPFIPDYSGIGCIKKINADVTSEEEYLEKLSILIDLYMIKLRDTNTLPNASLNNFLICMRNQILHYNCEHKDLINEVVNNLMEVKVAETKKVDNKTYKVTHYLDKKRN